MEKFNAANADNSEAPIKGGAVHGGLLRNARSNARAVGGADVQKFPGLAQKYGLTPQ